MLARRQGPAGDTFALERDRTGRHGSIMKYNLNLVASMSRRDLAARASRRGAALHAFFVAWFRGGIGSADGFRACERALAADFRMVTPDGGRP